jgi:hypothetical protein
MQRDVAKALLPELVQAVLDGYHATLFAYGQTGSGKSYTMEGYEYSVKAPKHKGPGLGHRMNRPVPRPDTSIELDDERMGLTPRAVSMIFDRIKQQNWSVPNKPTCLTSHADRTRCYDLSSTGQDASRHYSVRCSFLQIYNEQILDLLGTTQSDCSSPAAGLQQVYGSRASVFRGRDLWPA